LAPLHRDLAHLADQLGATPRARRLLHHLLVPPLDRAVALEQVHHVAVLVAQHLDLDVARPHDGLLQVHRRVAEGS
jgi:copper oxidase (laccase) domain-containing protein